MYNNLVTAVLEITPKLSLKGVYYIGQYGTSGYASAAKGYLYFYFINGIPITWDPLYFDNSKLDSDNVYDVVAKSLINNSIPIYDMVILHSTPDLWPSFWKTKLDILKNKIVVGYCTWETNSLPNEWVRCINDCVNEVWCPSKYNEDVFRKSGVTIPIRVVPHIFLPQILPLKENVVLTNVTDSKSTIVEDKYTFYSIGEWNSRKGMDDLVKSFCETFTKNDKVRLILKVHYRNYLVENKLKCSEFVNDILKLYPDHPEVICIIDNMTSKEILGLHAIGDCYISLTKAEGFGLTIFDAYNYGKKIITTGYSGHIDFLGKDYPGLVKYNMVKVSGMSSFSTNYKEEQEWAQPDLEHAKVLMKGMVNL